MLSSLFWCILIRKSCGNKAIRNYSCSSSILLKPQSNFNWKHKSRGKNWVFSNTKLVFYISFQLLKHRSPAFVSPYSAPLQSPPSSVLSLGSLSQVCPLEDSLFSAHSEPAGAAGMELLCVQQCGVCVLSLAGSVPAVPSPFSPVQAPRRCWRIYERSCGGQRSAGWWRWSWWALPGRASPRWWRSCRQGRCPKWCTARPPSAPQSGSSPSPWGTRQRWKAVGGLQAQWGVGALQGPFGLKLSYKEQFPLSHNWCGFRAFAILFRFQFCFPD